ncbi:hypothetical protein scyTo_0008908 [Scyliorhinus torazame]|uniref:IBB domain-containing protein n=1 Tax=Scyliorhinus torazame TaxID=75743 RepID=A0A401PF20_SCYTO|nr:hypothetical protein [Scyliorhinus torazame]
MLSGGGDELERLRHSARGAQSEGDSRFPKAMLSAGKENFRLKSYKNNSLNPDEMRRRREEEGLQLRKQKREEQVDLKLFFAVIG